jgi:hypothetical protein
MRHIKLTYLLIINFLIINNILLCYTNVILIGCWNKETGIFQHNKAFYRSLFNQDIKLYKIRSTNHNFINDYQNNKKNILRNITNSIIITTCPMADLYNPGEDYSIFDISLIDSKSNIKLCYTVIESEYIHKNFIKFLNKSYDALIVPEDFMIEAFKSQGLKLPIFKLPLAIDILKIKMVDNILRKKINNKNKIFKFGSICEFNDNNRKNEVMLFKAFVKTFKNNKNIELNMHCKYSKNKPNFKLIENWIKKYNIKNVKLSTDILSEKQYLDFLKSLDCYILLSKGEGFSITPLEAITLEIPLILSNNTAHIKYCNQPFTIPINCPVKEYIYDRLNNKNISFHNILINDACNAMIKMYKNYKHYKDIAIKYGPKFALNFSYQELHKKYKTIVLPRKIIISDKNIIYDNYIETNSIEFYNKVKRFYNI